MIQKNKNIKEYLEQINEQPNKVKVFVDIIRESHDLPEYDLKGIGGRVANWIKLCNKDYNTLMHIIWDTKDKELVGSRVDYITRILTKNLNERKYIQSTDVIKSESQIANRYELQGDFIYDKQTGRRFDVNCPIGRMLKNE